MSNLRAMLTVCSHHYSTLSRYPYSLNLRRCLSNQAKYNDKVFAIPFAFDKRRAILETYLHGVNLVTPVDIPISDHFKRYRTIFKDLNASLRTLRVQPLYFPTWRVGSEALSKNTTSQKKETTYLVSRNMYYPGHHMHPLSSLSFAPFQDSPIVQWNESMSRFNDGTDVVCLPYTLSPLTFADTLRENLNRDGTFNGEKPRLLSLHIGPVYPILIPLYLVQYEVIPSGSGHKPEPLTIVLEGHKEGGAMFAEIISPLYLHPSISLVAGMFLSALKYKGDIPVEVTKEGKPSSFISIYRRDLPVNIWDHINSLYSSPIQRGQFRRQILNHLRTTQLGIDWNDIRIHPFTVEERMTFLAVKTILIREHMEELQRQQAAQTGDLATLHTFFYGVAGGQELLKTQPSWYHESLCRNTSIIKQ